MPPEGHPDLASYMREVLATHGRYLDRRRWPWPFVPPFYEVMSGGLAWPDELQRLRHSSDLTDLLRCLWAYRTSLMLGKPHEDDAGLAEVWRMALQACPHWVGFRPNRRTPTPKLLQIYREGRVRMRKCLRDMERETDGKPGAGTGDA